MCEVREDNAMFTMQLGFGSPSLDHGAGSAKSSTLTMVWGLGSHVDHGRGLGLNQTMSPLSSPWGGVHSPC